MTKHTIEVDGLPEGWKAVAYRSIKEGEFFLSEYGNIVEAKNDFFSFHLIIQKTKPRRVALIDGYDPSSPNGFD